MGYVLLSVMGFLMSQEIRSTALMDMNDAAVVQCQPDQQERRKVFLLKVAIFAYIGLPAGANIAQMEAQVSRTCQDGT